MSDAPEIHLLNAEAAEAAATNDYDTATRLLRQVLHLQQAALGPDHPDLATTLNNLALMRERAGDLVEARQSYRRAHAIAAAALPPDDPLVRVSDDNLNAFYQAYGRPGDSVTPPGASADGPGLLDFPSGPADSPTSRAPWPRVDDRAVTGEEEGEEEEEEEPATPSPALTRGAGGSRDRHAPIPYTPHAPRTAPATAQPSAWLRPSTLAAAVLVLLLMGSAAWLRVSSDGEFGGVPDAEPDLPVMALESESPAAGTPQDPMAAPPPAPAPPPVTDPAPPREKPPASKATASPSPPREEPAGRGEGAGPSVAEADVCEGLSRTGGVWRCSPLTGPVSRGSVYYYTRVRTARDLSVRHRWTRNGQTFWESTLKIAANPSAGYRTFTRQSVSGLAAGDWRVALVGPDGRILDERRFSVQ